MGLATFTIAAVRYTVGVPLTVRTLVYTGLNTVGYDGEAVVTVPETDGETVAVTISL